ncbi:citrate lyase beta subunit [Lysobacter sp. OAE881]|uniref:hypothetical protein n=1 Tax=Lysobacter sp. OAE881 TaxID=2663813 RepID=UPI00178BA67F
MTDVRAEADGAAVDLLHLYDALDVPAVILTLVDGVVVARCHGAADVLWFCKKILKAHEVPEERTVN